MKSFISMAARPLAAGEGEMAMWPDGHLTNLFKIEHPLVLPAKELTLKLASEAIERFAQLSEG